MQLLLQRVGKYLCAALAVVAMATSINGSCWAITAGQIDDFNDGDLHGWSLGQESTFPQVAHDNGQNGPGDHSLHAATEGAGGEQPHLAVRNDTQFDTGNWEGNWTAAGITQISMDVRNPNAFTLNMRIGIAGPLAGPEHVYGFGGGDTFFTDAIDVAPNPTGWQHIVFPVLPANFHPYGMYYAPPQTFPDPAVALAGVTQLRILHNPEEAFVGADTSFAPGDYNGNNVVDAADYVVWRSNPDSLSHEGASPDFVDQEDYNFWRSQFGAVAGGAFYLDNIKAIGSLGAGAGAGSMRGVAVVPEPASWLFMTGLFVFAWVLVRRRV